MDGTTAVSTTRAEEPSMMAAIRSGSTLVTELATSAASCGSGMVTSICTTSVEFTAPAEIIPCISV